MRTLRHFTSLLLTVGLCLLLTAAGVAKSLGGENLAAGAHTAIEFVAMWMKSPGHRANILKKGFTEISVGGGGANILKKGFTEISVGVGGNGTKYFTQVFGRGGKK